MPPVRNPLKAFWWNRFPNLGDALTPILLQSFDHDVVRAEPEGAEVCVIGSVLEQLGSHYQGAIVGTGFLRDGPPMHFPNARVLGVRGPLSAARAGLKDVVLGDAGLLAPRLVAPPRKPVVRVGLVPHYKDKGDLRLAELADRLSGHVKLIDIQAEPRDVIAEISACECVLSSSLHGLITAEAFGRRTGWLVLSEHVLGAGFKFRDHYAALGAEAVSTGLRGDETTDELAAYATLKDFDRLGMSAALERCFLAL